MDASKSAPEWWPLAVSSIWRASLLNSWCWMSVKVIRYFSWAGLLLLQVEENMQNSGLSQSHKRNIVLRVINNDCYQTGSIITSRQTFTVPVRCCLYYINRGRRTQHACRRHHSTDWDSELKQRRIQCKHSSVFVSCLWTHYDRLPQAPVPMSALQWSATPCESYQTLLL